ncbi:MAG: cysteine dioxygenase [Acidimicrobiales bacterium]
MTTESTATESTAMESTATSGAGRATRRHAAIAETMAAIRTLDAEHRTPTRAGSRDGAPISRDGVAAIRERLLALTAQTDLFSLDDYPPPEPDEATTSCLYRLAEDDDGRFALYANASRGGVSTPAHDHTTWAVVVGFAGQELNRFYRRVYDGGVEQIDEAMVEAGSGVAMLPDDLHSIHIDGPALNFHCYGLALERLDGRRYYNARTGEWKVFPAHTDIREARAGRESDR